MSTSILGTQNVCHILSSYNLKVKGPLPSKLLLLLRCHSGATGYSETELHYSVLFMNQLWVRKVTMEHGPFEDVFPIGKWWYFHSHVSLPGGTPWRALGIHCEGLLNGFSVYDVVTNHCNGKINEDVYTQTHGVLGLGRFIKKKPCQVLFFVEMIQFDWYFSNGMRPPTSKSTLLLATFQLTSTQMVFF